MTAGWISMGSRGDTTGSCEAPERIPGRKPGELADRCCTMKIDDCRPVGRAVAMRRRASRPPADVPMTTMSRADTRAFLADRRRCRFIPRVSLVLNEPCHAARPARERTVGHQPKP